MAKNTFLQSPYDSILPAEQPTAAPQVDQRQTGLNSASLTPPAEIEPLFTEAAKKYNVPVNVLMGIAHQESRYNPAAVGTETQWGRAKGMMQYLDSTAQNLGINPFDPAQAIGAAAQQIRERLDKGYSMADAVKEHFAGPDRSKWGPKTEAYGQEVMAKVGQLGEYISQKYKQPDNIAARIAESGLTPDKADALQKQLDKEEAGRYKVLTPKDLEEISNGTFKAPAEWSQLEADQQKTVDDQRILGRLGGSLKTGYKNTLLSLDTARFALGGGDTGQLAEKLAENFAEQQSKKKTTGEKEIDDAFKRVSDAKGVYQTVVEGLKAIGTSVSNPSDLAAGIAEQAPNMLPTMAYGLIGAGGGAATGAAVGSVIPGAGTAGGALTGAAYGGRLGMLAGTTATELGAEIQSMVGERLAESKKAPTAENIKAVLEDKGFQEQALQQGLAKGLTVGLVDQVFLGLGGKILGAPAKKEALKTLAEQGVDVSTGAAAKAALASQAGRQALKDAKPGIASRLGAGAAAAGVDAAGEVVGETASQYVARGEVDKGEALREGVYGLGQSIVEPVVGRSLDLAKQAGASAIEQIRQNPAAGGLDAQPTPPATPPAAGPVAPAPVAPPPQVSMPAGVQAGMEVDVQTPDGTITGLLERVQPTETGDFQARILTTDGQVYNFRGSDGFDIRPRGQAPQQTPNLPNPNQFDFTPEQIDQINAFIDELGVTDPGERQEIFDEVQESEDVRNLVFTKIKNDQKPATDLPVLPVQQDGLGVAQQPASPAVNNAAGSGASSTGDRAGGVPTGTGEAAATGVSGPDLPADQQPALTPNPTALQRIKSGTAYFGTPEKAQSFIDKNGLANDYQVVQTGKVRFEVKPKGEAAAPAAPETAAPTTTTPTTTTPTTTTPTTTTPTTTTPTTTTPVTTAGPTTTPEAKKEQADGAQAAETKQAETQGQEPRKEPVKSPLEKVEAEIADLKNRRALPVNKGQEKIIDEMIADLQKKAEALRQADKVQKKPEGPSRPKPGETGYTLEMAEEDLEAMSKNTGETFPALDDRVSEKIKRQEKLIDEMRAERAKKTKAANEKAQRSLHVQAVADAALIQIAGTESLEAFTAAADKSLVEQIKTIAEEYAGPEKDAVLELIQDGKPVLPKSFYESAYKQAKAQFQEQQKAAARDPQAYQDTLDWGLSAAGIADEKGKAEYKEGFDHALKGKTRSTLLQGGQHSKGYDDAQAWIKTEDGKAWFDGKPRKAKQKSTGESLRRWFDKARNADASDMDKAWETLLESTKRSEFFPIPEGVTPGAKEWLETFRNKINTFSENFSSRFVGMQPSRRRYGYYTSVKDAFKGKVEPRRDSMLAQADTETETGTDEQRLELAKQIAQDYQNELQDLAKKFEGVKNLNDIEKIINEMFAPKPSDWTNISKYKGETGVSLLTLNAQDLAKIMPPANPDNWSATYHFWSRLKASEETERKEKDRKDILARPRLDKIVRNARDVRKGRSVTAQELKDTFGFADVTIGEYVSAQEAEDHLNYSFDAFTTLADLIGAKPKDLSFGGKLHFSIGALGHGKFAAHFSPDQPGPDGKKVPVINVTKTRGDGSVFHEYLHAIDFLTTDPKAKAAIREVKQMLVYSPRDPETAEGIIRRFLSGSSYMKNAGIRRDDYKSQAEVGANYYKNRFDKTKFYQDAEALDNGRGSNTYWSNDFEPWARASEAFAFDTLAQGGKRDDYLVSDWVSDGKVTGKTHRGTPYPVGEERQRLNKLFADFFEAIEFGADGPKLKEGHPWQKIGPYQAMRNAWNSALDNAVARIDEIEAAMEKEAEEAKAAKERAESEALFGQQPEPTPPTADSIPEGDSKLSEDELSAIFDQEAASIKEAEQEEPGQKGAGDAINEMKWSKEDASALLDQVNQGRIVLVADSSIGLPVIQDMVGVTHVGYGVFKVENNDFTGSFTGGGAMFSTPSGKAYTILTVDSGTPTFWNREVVASKLRVLASEGKNADEKRREKVNEKSGKALADLSDEQSKTAKELAGEFAKHGVKGLDKTMEGLVKLFGGGQGKLNAFPGGFDEQTYAEAKKLFEEAAEEFRAAGMSFKDFVRVFFNSLIRQFGDGVKPYAIRFAKEYQETYEQVQKPESKEPEAEDAQSTAGPSMVVSDWVLENLRQSKKMSWQDLFAKANLAFGGTQAESRYTPKDAYDAVELAVNRYMLEQKIDPTIENLSKAYDTLLKAEKILDLLPTQTKRTAEMDEFQQFSTPPHFAYLANWVANLKPNDTYLEPSAGIGGLAVFGKIAGVASVTVNELSERRLGVLRNLPFDNFFSENAEQLNNILPESVQPTVIVMNPPFSATAGRIEGRRNTSIGARHIEQALKRLQPGGRLVAIVGEGMAADRPAFSSWWAGIKKEYTVRANIGLDGSTYAKYGTTFDNQLLVIDKSGPTTGEVIVGEQQHPSEVLELLKGVRDDRPEATQPTGPVADGTVGQKDAQEDGRAPDSRTRQPDDAADVGDGNAAGAGGRRNGAGADGASNDARGAGGSRNPAEPGKPQGGDAGRGQRRDDSAAGGTADGKPGPTSKSDVEVQTNENAEQGEVSNAVFEQYKPKKVRITGAKPHPTPLVESSAMASVVPPDPTYVPNLPKEVIENGLLSDAQLESVVYAGQAHSQTLKDGTTPRGFFLGDGTGVGKGRQISGIIMDNLRQGRTKAVWLSKKKELMKDAQRDFSGLGGDAKKIFGLHTFKNGDPIAAKDGILFVGYPILRSQSKQTREQNKKDGSRKSGDDGISFDRVRQIVNWLGQDFDGVVVFDEAHEMGNAVAMKGKRGMMEPSSQALAGLELQRALPKARVVYVSATGATEVRNLAYAERLGLWGEGTPFTNVQAFVGAMSQSVSAMELVAQNLKQMGLYLARSLSFDGVTYEKLEHQLSDYQRDVYNVLAKSWQVVLNNIDKALEITGVMSDGRAAAKNSGKIKSATLSAFWGSHQRFFNQIITAMQMPSVIEQMDKDLGDGKSIVLQITNTNEADQNRALAKMAGQSVTEDAEDAVEELDLTPREQLVQFVENSFPVAEYEEIADPETGAITLRQVLDSNGKPVLNKDAVKLRDELIEAVRKVDVPDSPLQMLMNVYGPDKVAEITGRTQRLVRNEEGKLVTEKRGSAAVEADSQAFKDGKKNILIFSQAGGTGFSFHADRNYKNQQQRVHYVVQAGWSADKAVQGFGRSHRTNQASPPIYRLVTTDIPAQKRFISSIARRLEQLGALTAGQRDTAGGSMFSASDNLESKYASQAVRQLMELAIGRGEASAVFPADLLEQMGLSGVKDEDTGRLNESKLPETTQFLNRVLSLNLPTQEVVFSEFIRMLDQQIAVAKQLDKFDDGLETVKHEGAEVIQEKEVYRDPMTKSAVRYVEVRYQTKNPFFKFADAKKVVDAAVDRKAPAGYFKNIASGRVAAIWETNQTVTRKDGVVEKSYGVYRTSGVTYEPKSKFKPDSFEKLTEADAMALWDAENSQRPKTKANTLHMVVGGILPLWDRFNSETVKVVRIVLNDGRRLLGRKIFDKDLQNTLENLNVESSAAKMTPEEIMKEVNAGNAVKMSNGWSIKQVRVSGEKRIEIDFNQRYGDYSRSRKLQEAGAFYERIEWKERFFIPSNKPEVLGEVMRVFAFNPVSVGAETDADAEPRYSVSPEGAVVAEFGPVYRDIPAQQAIKRVMEEETGEVIVSRPDVGDISLVYGGDDLGLAHIVKRRGDEILDRLPGLLQTGKIYTKKGQTARFFIGNDRDEAVIRVDWNGAAKAWLLSAYEKYPDLSIGKPEEKSDRSEVVDRRSRPERLSADDLRAVITEGMVGTLVQKMMDLGVVKIHDTAKTFPRARNRKVRGVQAATMPDGTIHMSAASLSQNNAQAVLMHEMFHSGTEKLIGSKEWGRLMGRMGSLYRQSEASGGKAREFFDKARMRVAAARNQGAVLPRMEVEEFAAYAIEEYESAPKTIRKWVDDLIGLVKAWLLAKFGKQLGQVTPAQLAGLAKMAMMDIVAERSGRFRAQPSFSSRQDGPGNVAPGFYSQLARFIDTAPAKVDNSAGEQWRVWINSNAAKAGVKKDEIFWSGLEDYLRLNGKQKLSKYDIANYLDQGGVRVNEVVLGGPLDQIDEAELEAFLADEAGEGFTREEAIEYLRDDDEVSANSPKYSRYTLPGGENYREVLLTLPSATVPGDSRSFDTVAREMFGRRMNDLSPADQATVRAKKQDDTSRNYKSSHWDQPNVLAHIRLNDRTDADGKRVLFVEELQSDWGQEGKKKGFNGTKIAGFKYDDATSDWVRVDDREATHFGDASGRDDTLWNSRAEAERKIGSVPAAPFVTKTEGWLNLALKKVMLMAVEGGYDKVAFVNGQQSADRYDLTKQVRKIEWNPDDQSDRIVTISPMAGNEIEFRVLPSGDITSISGLRALGNEFDGKKIADVVGKDIADKIMAEKRGSLSGNGLKVGGEGMKAFYDKIVPQSVSDLLKKVGGGKIEEVTFVTDALEEDPDEIVFRENGLDYSQRRQPGFTITPEMQDKISGEGLPLFSVAPEDADRALNDAIEGLDNPETLVAKDDHIGRVVGDSSLGQRLVVHPRTIAAIHPRFAPVYMTGVSQMETRDRIIADLGTDYGKYDALDRAGKDAVNKVLELGRLTSEVYSKGDLSLGVTNTGERTIFVVGEDGKAKKATAPINALLTGVGEVVKLTPEQIDAYLSLRKMFDRALDMMKEQVLDEFGYGSLAKNPSAANELRELAKDASATKAEFLRNLAKFIAEIEQAKRAGYVPFSRYGDYVVTVKERIANPKFTPTEDGFFVEGISESMIEDMVALGATQELDGWTIPKNKRGDVERLSEKTVYSAKVETGLRDFLATRKAEKVEDIPAVKAAIDKARSEWVGGNPARRIVSFKANNKKASEQVSLTDVDALAEVANIDNETWDAVREKLSDAIKSRSFRKHFFHSDNVPGYNGDFERSIADYVIGMGGYLSRRQHMRKWENTVSAITDQPKLFEYASKYRDYVNDPQEELALVRQIGFFAYIAGVMATALANLTQVPLMAVPTLSQVAPTALVLKEVSRAYGEALAMLGKPGKVGLDMFDPAKAPADVRDALTEAWNEGVFVPLETYDLMMTARQRNIGARRGVRIFNKTSQVVAVAFTFAERMNRLVTFIAAARLADKRAVKMNAERVLANDALAKRQVLIDWNQKNFAEWVVDESQYRMGKANRPTIMRGVGSALLQFKGFMIQTYEAWYRMSALHGKEGQMAALASITVLATIGGFWGLPGADDLRKLIEKIYRELTEKDLDLKTELRAWVAETSGSNTIGQIVSKGASYPLGVDMTRVGLGSIVPDSPLAALGIPFDLLVGRAKRAFEKAANEDYLGAAAEMTPNFMKNALVAGVWKADGVRDKRGNRILLPEDLSGGDLAMKSMGFQPTIVSDIRDYEYAQRRQETAVDGLKREYTNRIARILGQIERTSDTEKVKELEARLDEVYAKIDKHNESAGPDEQIQIGVRAIRNRMERELGGVDSTFGKERKQARESAREMRGLFGLEENE